MQAVLLRQVLKQLNYYLIKKGLIKKALIILSPVIAEFVREKLSEKELTLSMKKSLHEAFVRLEDFLHLTPKATKTT